MTARLRALAPLALALLAAVSCARSPAGDRDEDAAPVVPVRAVPLAVRPFRESAAAPGQWRATAEVVVAAPFAAYVESLRVEVGDLVPRGAVLGLLTTRESRAAVLGAEQLLASASDPLAREQAQRALAQARRDVVRVPLVATAGGTVVRRTATAGAEVAEGAELLALVSAQSLRFEAHVPERDAPRLAPGQPAEVAMEDAPQVAASVARVLPQTSAADQAALAWLVPARAVPAAWLNRFGTATIVTGATRRALAVPDSALVSDDLTGALRVATVGAGGVARWVTVRVGLASEGAHELLSPALPAGTRVIVSGQRGLPDSTRVTLQP